MTNNTGPDVYFVMAFTSNPSSQAHVTFLAHAVDVEGTAEHTVLEAVTEVVSQVKPFRLIKNGVAWFGVEQNKPVQTFYETDEATNLHSLLCSVAAEQGLILSQPDFAGLNFSPHMSLSGNTEAMDSFIVDSLTVSRHVGGFGGPVINYPPITLLS
jgi:2'-5' RNA ligase